MEKRNPGFLVFMLCIINLSAQTTEKKVNDAFLISRMVEKFHVQPRPLNDEMSEAIYSRLFESLDGDRIFFLQEDITKLSAYRFKLDDEIIHRQSNFLQLLIATFTQRLQESDTMVDNICKKPFNFYSKEKFTVSEDTSYPANISAKHDKFYKFIKLLMLTSFRNAIEMAPPERSFSKKMLDSLEPKLRKRANNSIKRLIRRILQSPQGIDNIIGNIYCQTLASCYDPHTAYFPADVKTSFESMLGNNPLIFGFSLTEGEDGKPEIGHLQPGSPAYLSGQVNEGDRILGIKWDNKESIDVSDAGLRELNEMLSESGGDKVNITVRKVDGTTKQVTLHKEKMAVEDEDNNKVKGFLLKGARIVGYISLPDFYSDWEDNSGVNGCANDVGKEIIKLKKENIQGLIIDLRYNGGGSLKEAVELTGIFIDAGPVAQLKERETKISTLKDVNRGTIYDGPLVILVNGNTASASELVAGSLQDYNRALIVGSPTYGKATGQIVLPLDTTVNIKTYNGKSQAESYIKLTTFKIYRVDGTTAQIKGVIPNIILPEAADANQKDREANEKFALNASPIDPNKYYTPLQPIDVVNPQNAARQELDSSAYFKATREYVQKMKTTFQKKNVSLLVDDFLKQNNGASEPPDFDDYPVKTPIYSVANHAFEERRIGNNKNLKDANEEFRANVADDPYVRIGYQVVSAMIK